VGSVASQPRFFIPVLASPLSYLRAGGYSSFLYSLYIFLSLLFDMPASREDFERQMLTYYAGKGLTGPQLFESVEKAMASFSELSPTSTESVRSAAPVIAVSQSAPAKRSKGKKSVS
jgi:hypothetical protein